MMNEYTGSILYECGRVPGKDSLWRRALLALAEGDTLALQVGLGINPPHVRWQ